MAARLEGVDFYSFGATAAKRTGVVAMVMGARGELPRLDITRGGDNKRRDERGDEESIVDLR